MEKREPLAYFETLYEQKFDESKMSRQETWDKRAGDWDKKYRREEERAQHESRVLDTAAWLRSHGLLGPDCDAADVGCGPGRFVAEFAKTARSVLGTDISPRMTAFGADYCKELGLQNTRFQPVNFPEADIVALGWEKKFDLVFSSITPAVSGLKGLDNLIAMSRAWCFNASFVYHVNDLHSRLMAELFGRPPKRDKTSHSQWFYELFSLLWFRGYYPETYYYKQHRDLRLPADRATAERLAGFLLDDGEDNPENVSRILRFLTDNADGDGLVLETSDCWYGWLLWDVRDRHARTE